MRKKMTMKIGVAITTHNQNVVTSNTIAKWRALMPRGSVLVVVDDASDVPHPEATFRFETNVGVARAKNKCLELLEDLGVEHFFLADNDCWPISRLWYKPYVESSEPHLSYQFLDLAGPKKLHDNAEIYRDSTHVAYVRQRGCLLYYKKVCLETVGGFDPIYARSPYEHSDLANRIHAAGLTTWRFADVANSSKLWHSMDEHLEVTRSTPGSEQSEVMDYSLRMYETRLSQKWEHRVEYREESLGVDDVLLATFLTSHTGPKEGHRRRPDLSMLSGWVESIERGGYPSVILADELHSLPRGYSSTQILHVEPSSMDAHYRRWLHIYQFLRANPQVRWVWVTDGTGVEVLRDPFVGMQYGKLYCSAERSAVGSYWMRTNHPARQFEDLFSDYGPQILLSPRVVGGDRETVKELAQKIITVFSDIELERFKGTDKSIKDVGDIAAFNKIAYKYYGSRLVYGPETIANRETHIGNQQARFRCE